MAMVTLWLSTADMIVIVGTIFGGVLVGWGGVVTGDDGVGSGVVDGGVARCHLLFVPKPVVIVPATSDAIHADGYLGAPCESGRDINSGLQIAAFASLKTTSFNAVNRFGVVFAHAHDELTIFRRVFDENSYGFIGNNFSYCKTWVCRKYFTNAKQRWD